MLSAEWTYSYAFKMLYALWGVSVRCLVVKAYYSYQDLADMLGQNVKTIKRKIAKMNIKSRRFGSSGHPRFSALDVHSIMLFNVPFKELNASQKDEVKDLVMYAE